VNKPWRFPPEPFEVWVRAGGHKGRNAAVLYQQGRNAAVISRDHATALAAMLRATP
jgi:hypothetical protein